MEDESLYNDRIKETIETYNVKILEIATGPGNVVKYILCKRPDFKIFGIDLSPNMIELAKQNNPQADCITACLIELGFDILDFQRKQYPEPDGSSLTDMIFIARKKQEIS